MNPKMGCSIEEEQKKNNKILLASPPSPSIKLFLKIITSPLKNPFC
jgi:hypothetical protein